MQPIQEIADRMGLDKKSLIPYGHYKAKVHLDAIKSNSERGKLILVTGMTPTKAGEGKTTTSIGLTQGLGKLGHRVIATLREPSLGPIFGIKGGGTGGGSSIVVPEDEINVHFTGDAHAVGSAHNLLAALTDNVAQRDKLEKFNPNGITWRRVTDVEDRALRSTITGLGGKLNAPLRETGFDIVTASEVMAILALSSSMENLRERLGKIVVGLRESNQPVTATDVSAVGSMMSLLRYAIQPNLVQTQEGQPVIVHTGPFGNIAHGCSSVMGDKLALGYSDYTVTEAGFGADLGFEKFMHIKARYNNLEPSAVVLVSTIRAIKSHGGILFKNLDEPNETAVLNGLENVTHLVNVIRSFGLPVVVAINRFPTDSPNEISIVNNNLKDSGAHSVVDSHVFSDGGNGGVELAQAVVEAASEKSSVKYLYDEDDSIENKVSSLAKNVYGAKEVSWNQQSRKRLKLFNELGWGKLPVCMAKTHLSISDKPKLKGHPTGYTFNISDVRASIGAGFIYPIAGTIPTMPGLPNSPKALDIDDNGSIIGL
jgi:formate--tetrahydrofolate ligase